MSLSKTYKVYFSCCQLAGLFKISDGTGMFNFQNYGFAIKCFLLSPLPPPPLFFFLSLNGTSYIIIMIINFLHLYSAFSWKVEMHFTMKVKGLDRTSAWKVPMAAAIRMKSVHIWTHPTPSQWIQVKQARSQHQVYIPLSFINLQASEPASHASQGASHVSHASHASHEPQYKC